MTLGILFDSKKEARRAEELELLRKGKVIKWWKCQPKFDLIVNGIKICSYRADFEVCYKDGHTEIEDVKGFKTPVYNLKKKMMKAILGIDIIEP